jgi:hypothetical protein
MATKKSFITEISEMIRRIYNILLRPTYVEPATSRVKVTLESASVTMSAVTSVTQLAGFDAKQGTINTLDKNLWYNSVRNRIS